MTSAVSFCCLVTSFFKSVICFGWVDSIGPRYLFIHCDMEHQAFLPVETWRFCIFKERTRNLLLKLQICVRERTQKGEKDHDRYLLGYSTTQA